MVVPESTPDRSTRGSQDLDSFVAVPPKKDREVCTTQTAREPDLP